MGGKEMKVKIFSKTNEDGLEKMLNDGLEENKNIEIKEIKQSYAVDENATYSLTSIWYFEKTDPNLRSI